MLAVTSSTIVNNTGADTGGIRVEAGAGLTATATLRNSIIAENNGPNLHTLAGTGSTVAITSLGYNLKGSVMARAHINDSIKWRLAQGGVEEAEE